MKILIVTQYFWPESARVTDIAVSLAKEGNEVTVLTGLPNYPQGHIYPGYHDKKNWNQAYHGVRIIRAKLIERRHDVAHRLLNYYSFPHYATKIAKGLPSDFDAVLVNEQSPIMLARPAIVYAKKHEKPLIMYEMDLWPESLLAGGIKKDSLVYRHYKKVSAGIYSQCDKIFVSTKEHAPYIKDLPGCSDLDVEYLPQYADTLFEENDFSGEDNGVLDVMFAGNVGKAQSIETIIKAADLLKGDPRIKFHIVGGGSELENSKRLAKELGAHNVAFYGQRPLEEMLGFYRLADVMLVTLKDQSYARMTIPGKTQSYMAAGKPIVGAINGSGAHFIEDNGIGCCCPSGDFEGLAKLIANLNDDELKTIGKRAREVYFEKYSKRAFINRLMEALKCCARVK